MVPILYKKRNRFATKLLMCHPFALWGLWVGGQIQYEM